MNSIWKKTLGVSIFGESHGPCVGITIDGFPHGHKVDYDFIDTYMKRRAPGGKLATPRNEADKYEILSGMKNGYTTGAPICAIIKNTDTRSHDYAQNDGKLSAVRPGHADYPAYLKYGGRAEHIGGGHYSGRLTSVMVFAGALCLDYMRGQGVDCAAHIKQIEDIYDRSMSEIDMNTATFERLRKMQLPSLDDKISAKFEERILDAKDKEDSVGAIIECAITGVPASLGAHMFDSVESNISQLIWAIPAIKGISFGLGFDYAKSRASQVNDQYEIKNNKITAKTNNCGGVLGGMTFGNPVVFQVAVKPTSSIASPLETVDVDENKEILHSTKGRHDPCIAVRAVPVVEAMSAIAILDMILRSNKTN